MGLAALAIFAILAAVVDEGWTQGFDSSVHQWVLVHRDGSITGVAQTITRLASAVALAALMIVGAAIRPAQSFKNRLVTATTLVAIQLMGMIARLTMANAVGRPRPPDEDWAAAASGYAFPSGHTTTATIAAILVAWTLCRAVPHKLRLRALVWSGALLWAGVIAWTRVYLGVHWPTDVAGGWAFGAAWATGGILVSRHWLPQA